MFKRAYILFLLFSAAAYAQDRWISIPFDSGNLAGSAGYTTVNAIARSGLIHEVMVFTGSTGGVTVVLSTLPTNSTLVSRTLFAATNVAVSQSFRPRQSTHSLIGGLNAATTNDAQVEFGLAEENIQCIIRNFNAANSVTGRVTVLMKGN